MGVSTVSVVSALCAWCSGKYMSAFEKGGEVSFDEEAAFCEHFTLHEIADSMPSAARRKVLALLPCVPCSVVVCIPCGGVTVCSGSLHTCDTCAQSAAQSRLRAVLPCLRAVHSYPSTVSMSCQACNGD